MRAAALLCLFLLPSSRGVCLDEFNTLCIDAAPPDANGSILFNATCRPSPGSRALTWCGFGFSAAPTLTMFPASVTVIQWLGGAATNITLEDRDAAVGYALPPCFAAQLSALRGGARDASGALRASWTRAAIAPPAARAAGYVDLVGTRSAIAASSAGGAPAAAACSDYMVPHTLVQPGVPFSFAA